MAAIEGARLSIRALAIALILDSWRSLQVHTIPSYTVGVKDIRDAWPEMEDEAKRVAKTRGTGFFWRGKYTSQSNAPSRTSTRSVRGTGGCLDGASPLPFSGVAWGAHPATSNPIPAATSNRINVVPANVRCAGGEIAGDGRIHTSGVSPTNGRT